MTNDPVKQPPQNHQLQNHQLQNHQLHNHQPQNHQPQNLESSLRQIAHDAIGTFAIAGSVFLAIWLMSLVLPNARNVPQPAPVIHHDFIER